MRLDWVDALIAFIIVTLLFSMFLTRNEKQEKASVESVKLEKTPTVVLKAIAAKLIDGKIETMALTNDDAIFQIEQASKITVETKDGVKYIIEGERND